MVKIGLLLLFLIIFLLIAYLINDRDIMAPSVLFIFGFILAVIAALINVKEWGIDLSYKTIVIIIFGNLSFLSADVVYKLIHKYRASGTEGKINEIKIESWKTCIVILIGIITLILYYREIVRLSSYAESYWQKFGVMVAYKRAITYGSVSVNTFVNQMTKVVYSFGYIYSFIFMNNIFALKGKYKFRRNLINLIPIIMYGIMSIVKGNRIDIMCLVVMLVFLYYMFLHTKIGWNKHISGKVLKKTIIIFAVGMVVFYYMKDLVGRVSSLNLLEYITQYIGGSIDLLDLYIRDGAKSITTVPFGETLTGLLKGIEKFGLVSVDIRKQLEFRYTSTGIYLGNVYTSLRRYYNDGGWLGLYLFPFILSYFMNFFYSKVRRYRRNNISQIYKIIIYASLIYVIPFQAMEDSFWINKVTIGYIVELVILYICLKFIFLKIKINFDKYFVSLFFIIFIDLVLINYYLHM